MTTLPTAFSPASVGETIQLAEVLAKSRMIPTSYHNKPHDIVTIIMWAKESGNPIMMGLQHMSVINGRPTMYGDGALALVTRHKDYAGHRETYIWDDDGALTGARCEIQRMVQGSILGFAQTFSVHDAQRAKLWGKTGPWRDYPRRMLQMRARSWCIRDSFPDALHGIGIYEEAIDIPRKKAVAPPVNPLDTAFGGIDLERGSPEEIEAVADQESSDTWDARGDMGRSWELYTPSSLISSSQGNGSNKNLAELKADATISIHDSADAWYAAFSDAMKIGLAAEGSPVDRRHHASVVKKINDDTIERLFEEREDLATEVMKRYKQLLARLSV